MFQHPSASQVIRDPYNVRFQRFVIELGPHTCLVQYLSACLMNQRTTPNPVVWQISKNRLTTVRDEHIDHELSEFLSKHDVPEATPRQLVPLPLIPYSFE